MDAEPCAAANRIYWGNYHDPQVKLSLAHRHAFNADMPALQKDCPFALEIAFPEQVDLVDMVSDSFDRDQLQSELAHEKLEWHNKAMLALLERSRAAFDRAIVKATKIACEDSPCHGHNATLKATWKKRSPELLDHVRACKAQKRLQLKVKVEQETGSKPSFDDHETLHLFLTSSGHPKQWPSPPKIKRRRTLSKGDVVFESELGILANVKKESCD